MKDLQNKILKAISEGILNALEFTLDDFNDSDKDYILKNIKTSSDLELDYADIRVKRFTYIADKIANEMPISESEKKTFVLTVGCCKYAVNDNTILNIVSESVKLLGDKCDLNWIDTSKVVIMRGLFSDLNKADAFNGDISDWDVSNVIDMSYMFGGSEFNGDISGWDVRKLVAADGMFFNSKFNGDISKWNTESLDDASNMFAMSLFNLPIGDWNMSNCVSISGIFDRAKYFNQDISKWDVSSVTYFNGAFFECKHFNLDLSEWDVSSAKEYEEVFTGCPIKEEYKPKFK